MKKYTSLADPEIAMLLNQSTVGVLPTDTVYGIVARALDKVAVARLYHIKHREGKPGTVIAADREQLEALGIGREYLDEVMHLWPNPVSVVLPAGPQLAYLDQGKASLAVRIPSDPAVQALLQQTGPLVTSSANMPGEAPATNTAEAEAYFGDAVDFYVGGSEGERPSSTVLLLQPDGSLTVLRQGAITIDV